MSANKYAPILDPEATGPRSWAEYAAARAGRPAEPQPQPDAKPEPKRRAKK